MIASVKYSNVEGDQVQITMEDGRVMIAPLVGGTWVHEELRTWIDTPGNQISVYKTEAELLEDEAHKVRAERDILLAQCDWTVLPDVILTEPQKALWLTYRQDLRELPEQTGFPFDVVWPTKP